MLVGPAVIDETLASYRANMDTPFVARLLLAMDAGEAAGGDKRGKQSAALLIQGPEPYRHLDMRVDDHAEPLVELRRLYGVAPQHGVGAPGGHDTSLRGRLSPLMSPQAKDAGQWACRGLETRLFRDPLVENKMVRAVAAHSIEKAHRLEARPSSRLIIEH